MIHITEVRITLIETEDKKLLGFATIVVDDSFVIKDLKIIKGRMDRGPMVCMPSRKLMFLCPACRTKNHLKANFCNQCGKPVRYESSDSEKQNYYVDIAHPVSGRCRGYLETTVLAEYRRRMANEVCVG